MKKTKCALAVVLLAACFFIAGCQPSVPVIAGESGTVPATLPPPPLAYEPPIGDAGLEYDTTATLFLPRADGVRLIAQQVPVTLPMGRHGAEAVLKALLSHPGNALVSPLSKSVKLQLSGDNPVEISRDVATVNLGTSAHQLEPKEFYTVCQAIANTLTEFSDIRYVNVLVAGVQLGLDVSASLPMGTLQRRTGEDLDTLWEQAVAQRVLLSEVPSTRRLSTTATLYFPARMGTGILPEVRNISFDGQTPEQLTKGLLQELSRGAEYLGNVPALPDLTKFLLEDPSVSEPSGMNGRKVTLRFSQDLNEALPESEGLTRSICLASLAYTITTFLPNVVAVEVYIGDELIPGVKPSSVYTQQAITFKDGLEQRSDFGVFLLDYCRLYFAADNGKLTAVNRPVPYYEAKNPRYLLLQLNEGPRLYDTETGLTGVLPQGLKDADLLGLRLEGDTMLVHFSDTFRTAASALTGNEERMMIYAIVNTLCESPVVSRVRFYVAGTQPETLAGEIYLPGEFLSSPGLVN
jgi:spore germination protein GerM